MRVYSDTHPRKRLKFWPCMECCISPVMTTNAIMGRRSEEHTSELQSQSNLVCRLLLEKKNTEQGCSSLSFLATVARRHRCDAARTSPTRRHTASLLPRVDGCAPRSLRIQIPICTVPP